MTMAALPCQQQLRGERYLAPVPYLLLRLLARPLLRHQHRCLQRQREHSLHVR